MELFCGIKAAISIFFFWEISPSKPVFFDGLLYSLFKIDLVASFEQVYYD
jgi:hypothetical protein